jgi:uncharacterized protein YbbC (DUF1343 family)
LPYHLKVKPSPNLPNSLAVSLYPSLCLFEGTVVSIGRGTQSPFQVIGHPLYDQGTFTFTPEPMEGAKQPKLNGEICRGISFTEKDLEYNFSLKYLIDFYLNLHSKLDEPFFINYFDLLAGTDMLRKKIESGISENKIKESWQPALEAYKQKRKKYLLYE